jgi:hypothetical protein
VLLAQQEAFVVMGGKERREECPKVRRKEAIDDGIGQNRVHSGCCRSTG